MELVLSSGLFKITKLLPKMALPIQTLASGIRECPFAHILITTWYYQTSVFPNIMEVIWRHLLVLICVSLITREVSTLSYAYCRKIAFSYKVHVYILCQCLNWVDLIDYKI